LDHTKVTLRVDSHCFFSLVSEKNRAQLF
jgi:hypothetical protein